MAYPIEDVEFVRGLMQRAHAAGVVWYAGQHWLTTNFDGFKISVSARPNPAGPDIIVRSRAGNVFVRLDQATLFGTPCGSEYAARPPRTALSNETVGAVLSERLFGRKSSAKKQRFAWLPKRSFSSDQQLIPLEISPA